MRAKIPVDSPGAEEPNLWVSVVTEVLPGSQAEVRLAVDVLPGQEPLDDGEELLLVNRPAPKIAEFSCSIKKEGCGKHPRPLGIERRLERAEWSFGHEDGRSETVLLSEGEGGFFPILLIDGNKDDLDPLGGQIVPESDQHGKLPATGPAPTGPSVHDGGLGF